MKIDEEVISEIEKRRKLADHYYDNFIKVLANVYKDKEIEGCLASAQTIHANFYHDFMDELMFEDNRKRTEKLLEKLVKILDAELKARLKGY